MFGFLVSWGRGVSVQFSLLLFWGHHWQCSEFIPGSVVPDVALGTICSARDRTYYTISQSVYLEAGRRDSKNLSIFFMYIGSEVRKDLLHLR